jgi:hypothetical protein
MLYGMMLLPDYKKAGISWLKNAAEQDNKIAIDILESLKEEMNKK